MINLRLALAHVSQDPTMSEPSRALLHKCLLRLDSLINDLQLLQNASTQSLPLNIEQSRWLMIEANKYAQASNSPYGPGHDKSTTRHSCNTFYKQK
jgi:hypothetical protein